ncbi:hypothetical protein F511_16627 [Dorcoceras hygrometricum]|uniref:Uncharacterized protein n=1 Tax=Dorcoceras hygrometricum TaxID=472368 RepID=A0A2Z7BQM7_9LAMI|nr:hypothetical protein F511_16627 [Dorcoceras hygrometricum]
MELVLAIFQRTNPPTFTGAEGGLMAEGWLEHMEELFDKGTSRVMRESGVLISWESFCAYFRQEYTPESYYKGTSRVMRESGVLISWESFCAYFRQEYTPESYYNNCEREFDNLKQGNMRVAECIVPEKSNAIIGVVTAGFECLPPSCDGMTDLDDHGPMISTGRFAVRGSSGNQAGQSGGSSGRSPFP